MDYSAIGQTTHLAARMEQMAMPGSILITPAVLGLADGYVHVKPLGPAPVKGLAAPVEVYELVGASGVRRRLQAAAPRGLTCFVGRDTELATLVQALERAGAGHGQVVAVVGEAGVGKSRLVYECVHSQHTQGWRVLESTSVSYGKATPYFPLIDLLKRYVHVEDADEPRTIRAKVTGQVLTLDETLQETIPALLWILDALPDDSPFRRLDPPQRRQHLLDALKRLLLRESQVQPMLLVCEDLHWIDTETQALLDRLIDSLPTARLLLLVNYRPEYQHGWGSKTYYTQLRLDALPPASADEVLQALLGDGTEAQQVAPLQALKQLLIARTEGNPFFLEESVRTLVETAELLYEARLFPELEYTFKHALTHEVAYASLLQERRRALHARIVHTFETLYADRLTTQVEQRAHHAFRGEVWEKAITYLRQAGTKAATRSSYQEAVTCCEQALLALKQLPEDPTTRLLAFDLRMELTRRLVPLADYGRILEYLREAEAIVAAQGDRRRLALVCSHITDYFRLTGHSEQALACRERALAFATALGDFPLQVLANQRLGHAYHAVGEYHRAVELLKQNIVALRGELRHERFGAGSLPSVMSRTYMAASLIDLGEFAEAVSIGEEAIRIANEADTAHSQVQAAYAVGLAYLYQGDFDRAILLLEPALTRCQVEHIPLGTRLLASTLGYAHARSGRVTEAVPLLEQAVQHTEALKIFYRYALWLAWLGEAYLLAGRTDDALEFAKRAAERARTYKEPGHQAYGLRLLGEMAAHGTHPDADKAEAAYLQALALAEELGIRPLQAHCHLGLGTLYVQTGRPEPARTALTVAIGLYRAMDMTFWLPQAEAALAQMGSAR
jgi:tetratricopeptide (TPR) repeat protein